MSDGFPVGLPPHEINITQPRYMTQNMTYDMTHLSNISNPFRRFSRRVLLLLALLLATAGAKAADYVLFWTGDNTTYYVGMNGNNIAVKTAFDPTCIWTPIREELYGLPRETIEPAP